MILSCVKADLADEVQNVLFTIMMLNKKKKKKEKRKRKKPHPTKRVQNRHLNKQSLSNLHLTVQITKNKRISQVENIGLTLPFIQKYTLKQSITIRSQYYCEPHTHMHTCTKKKIPYLSKALPVIAALTLGFALAEQEGRGSGSSQSVPRFACLCIWSLCIALLCNGRWGVP